ncbi:hypothetical protein CYV26_00810 [Carnobacterium maltaromaticum]|nr:hypothetical protein CYV33_05700 [Carnobacterium maltaromaticum]PLS37844.1 hypothetical protein CYV30_05695 [Carnobacterium maltaromaticum]PLS39785.1 hypothetical protein CYV31_03680 [Carnobacterium maltaromaticum]PLS44541.1 hypothetical protein CYV28_05695 [Carnobacterium maltaromaticum]PLS46574.1 hypothetical protein CYV27_05690 [Carnobacterium maltaromaticum]
MNLLDFLFFLCIHIMEIFFIYHKKNSLFLASIFSVLQNSLIIFIWTVTYDIPLINETRRLIFIDFMFIQIILLLFLLFILHLLNKRFSFLEAFLAINKKYNFYSFIMLIVHVITIFVRQYLLFTNRFVDYLYWTIFLLLFTFICILIACYISTNYKNSLTIKTLSESSQILENKNLLSQEFKHDYKNILYGIKEYLANDDIEGATDYLNSVISYSSKLLTPDYYFLIKDVPIPAVQGVLISMVKHCEEHGLDVILTVQSFPKKLSMDLIDFIRCFSILINNALEHSIQKIYVSFIGKNNQLEVTVKNTYKEQINLLTIFRKNYSTKKDHAGIGLSIFQKIISSYNNTHYRVDTTKEWITFSFYIE